MIDETFALATYRTGCPTRKKGLIAASSRGAPARDNKADKSLLFIHIFIKLKICILIVRVDTGFPV